MTYIPDPDDDILTDDESTTSADDDTFPVTAGVWAGFGVTLALSACVIWVGVETVDAAARFAAMGVAAAIAFALVFGLPRVTDHP